MTKTFCDMCKEKEIKGAAAGSFTFSFTSGSPLEGNWIDITDRHLLLCEECRDKIYKFICDNELDKEEKVYR